MVSRNIVDVNAETWEKEVLKSDTPVVVEFWHPHCGFCEALNPIYDELSNEYVGKLKFAKLNVSESSENRSIAILHGIMGTPTVKLFCEGGPFGEIIGYHPKDQFKQELDKLLEHYEKFLGKTTPLSSLA